MHSSILFFVYFFSLSYFFAGVACSNSSYESLVSDLGLAGRLPPDVQDAVAAQVNSTQSAGRRSDPSLACNLAKLFLGNKQGSAGVPEYLDDTSSLYNNRTDVNWSDNCWQQSRCIVAPSTSKELSLLMRVITFTNCKFAVRSGGHNFNIGFGSIGSSGMLVDVANFNQVTLSQDKETASIGAGVRMGQAYQQLDKLGYYVNGGKDPNPGFGGLMIGGGITFLASQYGMAANGIKNVELILPNASIVNANASSNADLWWAVKGGGPNYGIITRYDLEAIPTRSVWYEFRVYSQNQTSSLLKAVLDFQKQAEQDDYASLVFQSLPAETIVGFIYAKPTPYPSIFSSFYNISYLATFINSTVGTVSQLVEETGGVETEVPMKQGAYSVTFKPDAGVYNQTYAKFLQIAQQASSTFNGTITYGLQPVTSNTVRQTMRNGGLPLNLTEVEQTWFITTVSWVNDGDSAAALKALRSVGKAVEDAATRRGVYLPQIFMNDALFDQNVLGSYGARSLERLRSVAQNYDREGVMQKLQNNGFLLSKVPR